MNKVTCPQCKGQGVQTLRWFSGDEETDICDRCEGSGMVKGKRLYYRNRAGNKRVAYVYEDELEREEVDCG